jgi:hypothetical protein
LAAQEHCNLHSLSWWFQQSIFVTCS